MNVLTPLSAATGWTALKVLENSNIWDSQVLIAFLTVTVPLLVGQWLQLRAAKKSAEAAAEKIVVDGTAAAVQIADQKTQLNEIQATGQETHDLANSQKDELERMNADQRSQMRDAGITPNEQPRGSQAPPK